jgi:hypothetical protein
MKIYLIHVQKMKICRTITKNIYIYIYKRVRLVLLFNRVFEKFYFFSFKLIILNVFRLF